MNIRQTIQALIKQGHKVSFFQRKDGGVRITRIDGQSFKGSEGNKVARFMTGTQLSERRSQQLEKISIKGKKQFGNKKKSSLSEQEIKQINRLQRLWKKKNTRSASEQGLESGYPTRKNYRYIKETYGIEEAQRRLNEAERYALGLVYNEKLNSLIARLKIDKDLMSQSDGEYIQEVIDLMEEKRAVFKEAYVAPLQEAMYEMEKTYTIKGTDAVAEFKREAFIIIK